MTTTGKTAPSFWITGLLFSALWASASVASKIGLQSAQPFVLSFFRFCMASAIMLSFSHLLLKKGLPKGRQWKQLAIFGLLNVALYLGLYILAISQVSAGLGSLAVALNPVIITVMHSLFQRQKIPVSRTLSLLIGVLGVAVCAYPLIISSHATIAGMFTLFLSVVVYSGGTIYFQKIDWQGLHRIAINGWQTLFGALFTLPLMLWQWNGSLNHFNGGFWGASGWLALMVSICAVQSWIYLLHHFGEKSSYWLFLSPIFGFVYSHWLTGEPLTIFTLAGTILVLAAMALNVRGKASPSASG